MANIFDQLVATFNPQVALKRERARTQLDLLRKYDGASKGRRAENWLTAGTSADAAASAGRSLLRDRSRDLVRNNSYASKAVQVIVSNTIGTGIIGQARAQRSRQRSQRLTDTFTNWANDPSQVDYHGQLDFNSIQCLVLRTIVESGEVLIRRVISPEQKIPLQLLVIEPDFLDTTKDVAIEKGGIVRDGIEYNKKGKRVAYHIYDEHPGERHLRAQNINSTRVPADDILHVYRQDRPGMQRGIPWAAPVMLRMRDFDDYNDAQLLKQKISACFAAFAVDTESPDMGMGGDLIDKIEPGMIEILPPGKDLRFANPPTIGEFDKISRQYLLQIAAGFGITYEALTGDLHHTSFSSGRMGWLEFQRNIENWRWHMIIPQFLNPVWKWFVQSASTSGVRMEGTVAQWTPPRRDYIDPSKEINATIDAVRGGMMSLSEAIRENGYDPEEVMLEMQQDNKRLDALGLVVDSDPRKITGAGQNQSEPRKSQKSSDDAEVPNQE